MKVNNFDNKMSKESNKLLKKLNIGMRNLSDPLDNALKLSETLINDNFTPKEQIQWKAFREKYTAYLLEGKTQEAEDLKKHFSEQF